MLSNMALFQRDITNVFFFYFYFANQLAYK